MNTVRHVIYNKLIELMNYIKATGIRVCGHKVSQQLTSEDEERAISKNELQNCMDVHDNSLKTQQLNFTRDQNCYLTICKTFTI